MNQDFLGALRRKRDTKPFIVHNGEAPEVKIQLYFPHILDSRYDGICVRTVDNNGKPIDADSRYYSGPLANLLRAMEKIISEREFSVSWGDSPDIIRLKEYPHLAYMIAACRNLVDGAGEPLTVSESEGSLLLLLLSATDIPTLTPVLSLKAEDKQLPVSAFLSDSFVIADNTLYPITAIEGNPGDLEVFLHPFEKQLVASWLSIFYSYLGGSIQVDYDDRRLRHPDTKVEMTPTIIFDKVDSERALYLRATDTIPGLPPDIVSDFDITAVASVSDSEITVRDVETGLNRRAAALLDEELHLTAKTKAERAAIYQDGDSFIIGPEVASPFLVKSLPRLARDFRLIGAEKLRDYKVRAVKPQLSVKLSSGIDFLEGDAEVDIDNEKFSIRDLLAQYASKHYVELENGDRALIDDEYIRRLQRVFHTKGKSGNSVEVSFFDLPEIEALLQEKVEGKAFERGRKVFRGFNDIAGQKLSLPAVNATLRPYQEEGVKWIKYLFDNKLGGCLADDMGLGKTLQTISMLTMIYPGAKRPTLIVMPRSLLFNWQDELRKFAPHLNASLYYGPQRNLKEALESQIVMTTYAIVRNDIEELRKLKWEYVILDESQNIKNLAALTTKAVTLLDTTHRLALSGTPIENNLTELYSLFRFLNPAMFGTVERFNSDFAVPIQKFGDEEATESLRRKIYPFILRRLKRDVLKDLPDRIEQTLYVEMEGEQASFYERRRREYYSQIKSTVAAEGIAKSQFVLFQALSELRRIASVPESLTDGRVISPKREMLVDSVTEAVANGHKTVVFFNFIAGLELVGHQLSEHGIGFVTMTGATSTKERAEAVRRFQNDPDCMVFLMTVKTGGVGLNLTAADTVFIFEPWWNKAVEEQAVNRLHRIGQTQKVHSYSIIVRGTIEEKILQLQEQKKELFDALIGSDSASAKNLTEEDIDFIFK